MAREDVGSWIAGPKAALESQGAEFGFPGERIGLPKAGPGSVASVGRKASALIIDWATAYVIAKAIGSGMSSNQVSLLILEIFAAQVAFATALTGSSFGQRLLGLCVVSLENQRLTVGRVIVRTLLICLVIPAVIYDRDNRGFHDKAVNSVVINVR
jgi:uncharacterized RDD family membrane protein YckC